MKFIVVSRLQKDAKKDKLFPSPRGRFYMHDDRAGGSGPRFPFLCCANLVENPRDAIFLTPMTSLALARGSMTSSMTGGPRTAVPPAVVMEPAMEPVMAGVMAHATVPTREISPALAGVAAAVGLPLVLDTWHLMMSSQKPVRRQPAEPTGSLPPRAEFLHPHVAAAEAAEEGQPTPQRLSPRRPLMPRTPLPPRVAPPRLPPPPRSRRKLHRPGRPPLVVHRSHRRNQHVARTCMVRRLSRHSRMVRRAVLRAPSSHLWYRVMSLC